MCNTQVENPENFVWKSWRSFPEKGEEKCHENAGDRGLFLLAPIPFLFAVDATAVLLAIQAHGLGFPYPFLPPFPEVFIVEGN
jgi:hypothetical protein